MKSKRDEEINKSILEYLLKKNFQNSALAFMSETNLKTEDATKGNKLDKKWGTIISLQKKILDLETNLVQLKEDLENGMNPNKNQSKKNLDSIGLPKSISKVTLRGHRKEITCLAFHPFYKKLASSSEDASIIIWECDDFSQDKSVKAHSNTINHITFDNNGKFLGSCSSDLSIKIWNFENNMIILFLLLNFLLILIIFLVLQEIKVLNIGKFLLEIVKKLFMDIVNGSDVFLLIIKEIY